jgi:hypothetical protein
MADPKQDDDGDLAETKRIMERLVRTPPKPHKDKGGKADEPRLEKPVAKSRRK